MAEKKTAREWLNDAQAFDCSTLEQSTRLGESLKLTDVAQNIERALAIYLMIDADVLDVLPAHVGDNLADRLRALFAICDRCLKFDPQEAQSKSHRDQLLSDAKDIFGQSWGDSHTLLAATARFQQVKQNEALDALFDAQSQRYEAMIATSEAKARQLSTETASTLERASQALESAREAAAATGVYFQANKFQEAADEHRTIARGWLAVLTILCTILAAWALAGAWVLKWMEQKSGIQIDPAQLIASKVLVFGVLSFAAIIVSRSYFAHCHNAVVNLHRQNALQTYKAIVEATGDDASRNTILQQAAACIFAPQSSGYSKESNGKPSSVNIIETIGSHLTGRQEF